MDSDTDPERSQQSNEFLGTTQQFPEEFRRTHECRLSVPSLALMDAMAQAGPTPWRGIQAIPGYKADGSIVDAKISTLLIRGEYDFCTDACMEGWKDKIVPHDGNDRPLHFRTIVLPNCSHYTMLEDERLYGEEVTSFLLLCDPK
jgi:pimeloyl-ACP methyl ester carboxylesterase